MQASEILLLLLFFVLRLCFVLWTWEILSVAGVCARLAERKTRKRNIELCLTWLKWLFRFSLFSILPINGPADARAFIAENSLKQMCYILFRLLVWLCLCASTTHWMGLAEHAWNLHSAYKVTTSNKIHEKHMHSLKTIYWLHGHKTSSVNIRLVYDGPMNRAMTTLQSSGQHSQPMIFFRLQHYTFMTRLPHSFVIAVTQNTVRNIIQAIFLEIKCP